jgi:hypothetical protein
MNWRTTAVLFLIVLLLGGYVYYQSQQETELAATPTPAAPTPERVALITNASVEQIERLDITRIEEGTTASFQRNGRGNWTRTVPTTTQVISQTLNTHVTGLINLRSSRSLAPDLNPLSAYGLEEPAYEIVLVATGEGDRRLRYTLLVGDETPTGNSFYVQKRGDPQVYTVPKGSIENVIGLLDNPPLPEPTAEEG